MEHPVSDDSRHDRRRSCFTIESVFWAWAGYLLGLMEFVTSRQGRELRICRQEHFRRESAGFVLS